MDFNYVNSCLNDKRFCSQKQDVSAFVAAVVQDKLVDPKTIYTPTNIQRDIQKTYGMDLSYMQAWRSKEKAMQLLRGTQTIYASIRGWIYCRPTIVVDGSFLKLTYRGTIFTASTQDTEGLILPLAYAIVDSENDASWERFFVQFRKTYGQREGMCIILDMHDGIWRATSIVYQEVPHCASRAYTIEEFNRHTIDAIDSRVKTYLMDIGYDKWSRAHFKTNRTMTMTSNITESVNAANKHARDLTIVNLLDFMTTLIQKWIYTNRKDAMEYEDRCKV
ncbi:uncharacterized protein LOC142171689 [Nicotiana tabacum]|uniref:Uncharacterized protein LOC142171689 n=1 Tax=Nicotiana tabacum TaxID=4097 RepID=A0AC58T2P0_TOBAC